jgi:threonine aldolase
MAAVNLLSDTQTRPTDAMRQAMARAEVGDEQLFEDPTVRALCERVAELLGHEAAVFLPTGTMCNAISYRLHIRPGGDEIVLHRHAHPIAAEAGSPAALAGAVLHPIDSYDGTFTADELRDALRPPGDRYTPRSRLLHIEQTANLVGGRVWPLLLVRDLLAEAAEAGLRTHLDGARLLNAVAATGTPADEWASDFDTAWIDFSKGLGAPMGACLAGSAELIEEAWRYKQMLGGAMRQAGIVAAGALHALDHHVERLGEDQEHARALAEGLAELDGVDLDLEAVETNIVVFRVERGAGAFTAAMAQRGVRMGALDAHTVRAVTHLDVDRAGIDTALDAAREVLAV